MTAKQFQIDNSIIVYFTEPAVQSTIDYILEKESGKIPTDLDWTELENFHQAFLSAQQMRSEYCIKMIELWNITWGHLIEKSSEIKKCSLSDFNSFRNDWLPTPKFIFDDSFTRIHKYCGGTLVTYAWIDISARIAIGFHYQDAKNSYKTSDGLELSKPWLPDPLDSERIAYHAKTIADEQTVIFDITDLVRAAKEAVTKLEKSLN